MDIALVAAEPSGDQLGAGLMKQLRIRWPRARFRGIGGPSMMAQGLVSQVAMERLSVMGLTEVLRHLPELLRIRRELRDSLLDVPPDLFIGIDAPDFNLPLEKCLKRVGIPVVHYVSPTVWAWRGGRVKSLREATDRVLCIFPFEEDFLRKHDVNAVFVGHPLAEHYPLRCDQHGARETLGLGAEGPVLALLPGSRRAEIARLAAPFLLTARRLLETNPGLRVVTPLANTATRDAFTRAMREYAPALDIQLCQGGAGEALCAADVVLSASGTATFEALLCKKPMVVGYRVAASTYWIARLLRLVETPHFAMANLLAGERLAPEYIQYDCVPDRLAPAIQRFFDDVVLREHIAARYAEVHRQMRQNAGRRAAETIVELLERRV